MAINPTFASTPVLSKVKLGNEVYYLKDSDLREIVSGFGNATAKDVAPSITNGGTGLVTSDQVYDFVIAQIGGLGVAVALLPTNDHTTVTEPVAGSIVVEDDGSEWIYDGEEWRVIGSESAYVLKTFTIAGIDMQDNITAAELKTALGLKALAYKDNGSVSISTADSITAFSTGKAGSYNVSSTPVSVPATFNALDVTPAGSVTITNITVTPATANVATVTDEGTNYSLSGGGVTHATDSTSNFATAGLVGSIGTGTDAETLILSNASTAAAVTAVGNISYTAPTLSGSLPTFDTESVVTGITSASGTASFSGTSKTVTPTAKTTVNAAGTDGSVTVASESITPTLNKTAKTVNVSFGVNT